jgi:hypothetical protein
MALDQSTDKRFVVFSTPLSGIRALAKILMTYSYLYEEDTPRDLDTVRELINRWAPPVENDTGAYVAAVAKSLNVAPDDKIDVADQPTLTKLVTAIIHHENGRVMYEPQTIIAAVTLALSWGAEREHNR